FQIQGLTGSGTNAANVQAYVASTDSDPSPTDPTVDVQGGLVVNYTAGSPVAPMLAKSGPVAPAGLQSPYFALTTAELAPILAEAIRRWESLGVTQADRDRLEAVTA